MVAGAVVVALSHNVALALPAVGNLSCATVLPVVRPPQSL